MKKEKNVKSVNKAKKAKKRIAVFVLTAKRSWLSLAVPSVRLVDQSSAIVSAAR